MKLSVPLALAAISLAASWGSAANAASVIHYDFSPGSYFNPQGSPNTPVVGSFDYDPSTGLLSNVSYTSYFGTFTTGAEYTPGVATQIYFGTFGTDNYDVYQLASSLADGGSVVINSGTHPAVPISAGGSLTAASITGTVPEPATWAMMIGGFGMVGGSMRYRRRNAKVTFATA